METTTVKMDQMRTVSLITKHVGRESLKTVSKAELQDTGKSELLLFRI